MGKQPPGECSCRYSNRCDNFIRMGTHMKKFYANLTAAGFAAMIVIPGFSQESLFGKFEELQKQLPEASGEFWADSTSAIRGSGSIQSHQGTSEISQTSNEIWAVSNTGGNYASGEKGGTVKTGDASASVFLENRLGSSATTSTSSISIIMEASTNGESVIKRVIEEKNGSASIKVEAKAHVEAGITDSSASASEDSIMHNLDERGSRGTAAELRGGAKGVISLIKFYISYVFSIFTGKEV